MENCIRKLGFAVKIRLLESGDQLVYLSDLAGIQEQVEDHAVVLIAVHQSLHDFCFEQGRQFLKQFEGKDHIGVVGASSGIDINEGQVFEHSNELVGGPFRPHPRLTK